MKTSAEERRSAPLRDLARVTLGREQAPTTRAGELDYEAQLVYMRLRAQAEEQSSLVHEHRGEVGYFWEGYIIDVFRLLWAETSPVVGIEDFNDARTAVTDYLKTTGNITCTQRGQRSAAAGERRVLPSRWWIRGKYADVQVTRKAPAAPTTTPAALAAPAVQQQQSLATEGTQFRCRESGCTEGPFNDSRARAEHEREQHPDTKARNWLCYWHIVNGKRTCDAAFYNLGGLSVHMARAHGCRKEDENYQQAIVMSRATAMDVTSALPSVEEEAPPMVSQPAIFTPPPPPPPVTPPVTAASAASMDYKAALDVLASLVTENTQLRTEVTELKAELARAQEGGNLRDRLFDLLRETDSK